MVLKHRTSSLESLCPVVTCPYFCSSERAVPTKSWCQRVAQRLFTEAVVAERHATGAQMRRMGMRTTHKRGELEGGRVEMSRNNSGGADAGAAAVDEMRHSRLSFGGLSECQVP